MQMHDFKVGDKVYYTHSGNKLLAEVTAVSVTRNDRIQVTIAGWMGKQWVETSYISRR